MKLPVWIWYHNWGDDSSTSLYPSEQAAKAAVAQYVQEQWNEGVMDDEEFSGDPDTDIEKYFTWHEDQEYYTLYSQTVEWPNLPDVPEEEVVLTPDECAITVLALELEGLPELGKMLLGMDTEKVEQTIQSAYQKLKD